MKFKKQIKMVKHKLVLFATVVALKTLAIPSLQNESSCETNVFRLQLHFHASIYTFFKLHARKDNGNFFKPMISSKTMTNFLRKF